MHFNVWVSPHIKPLNKLMNQGESSRLKALEWNSRILKMLQHILKTLSIVHKIILKHFDSPTCGNLYGVTKHITLT